MEVRIFYCGPCGYHERAEARAELGERRSEAWRGMRVMLALVLASFLDPLGAAAADDRRARIEPARLHAGASFDCSAAPAPPVGVPQSECEALVRFYHATGGPQWEFSFNWLSASDVCDWGGVTCGFIGGTHVIELNLHDNNLSGSLPGEVFAQLSQLEFVKLSQNSLTGSIPAEIGGLQRLHTLVLDSNRLTGSIPGALAGLDNLTSFQAVNNRLTGRIPEALMGFCAGCPVNGKYGLLNLTGNDLQGELPTDIGRIEISTLDFRNNPRLSGPIPATYAMLRQVGFFGYLGTDVCTPADPDIQTWLGNIQTVLGSRRMCVEGFSISGRIVHVVTGEPFLDPITVTAGGGDFTARTDDQGFYELAGVPAGTYTVAPEEPGLEFVPASQEVTVGPDADRIDFVGRLAGSIVSGRVTDDAGRPIADVILETFPPVVDGITDEDGRYVIDGLEPGMYEIEPIGTSFFYDPPRLSFTVPPDATEMNFVATPLSFEPTVSAEGPGWGLDDLVLDPDPDLSSLLEIGKSLRYSCSPAGTSATTSCALPPARVAFESVGGARRCVVATLYALPPDDGAAADYSAALDLAELPAAAVCDAGGAPRSGTRQATVAATLGLTADEEGFTYQVDAPGLILAVESDLATIEATGRSLFSVRHRPASGATTVDAYVGSIDVTPASPALPAFVARGERVTITSDAVASTTVCAGDCGVDGRVTVNELITGVNIALGSASAGRCPAFDTNANGAVAVNELIGGVNGALGGCPSGG